jgi:hypothetical protein
LNKPTVLYVMANEDNMEHSEVVNMAKIVNANSLKELAAAIRQLAATLTPPETGAPPAVPLQNIKLSLSYSSRPARKTGLAWRRRSSPCPALRTSFLILYALSPYL